MSLGFSSNEATSHFRGKGRDRGETCVKNEWKISLNSREENGFPDLGRLKGYN